MPPLLSLLTSVFLPPLSPASPLPLCTLPSQHADIGFAQETEARGAFSNLVMAVVVVKDVIVIAGFALNMEFARSAFSNVSASLSAYSPKSLPLFDLFAPVLLITLDHTSSSMQNPPKSSVDILFSPSSHDLSSLWPACFPVSPISSPPSL